MQITELNLNMKQAQFVIVALGSQLTMFIYIYPYIKI